MTLAQLKKMLLESSGRYDLYESSDSVWNLTTFINAGVRYLDVQYPPPEQSRWYKKDIASGDVRLSIAYLRSVKEVWVADSEKRSQLDVVASGWLRQNYSNSDSLLVDTGVPKYWSYDLLRLAPSQADQTQASHDDFTYSAYDILFDTTRALRGIQWMPPADQTYTMEVLGTFYTEVLSDASDVNYWSMLNPDAVILAAVLCIERHYRNMEGVAAQKRMLDDLMKGDESDKVEQETAGVSVMEG
jgi:hypothetical protein